MVIDPPLGKKQTFTDKLKPPLTDAELEQEYDLLSSWSVQNENDAYEMGVEFPTRRVLPHRSEIFGTFAIR